MFAFTGSFEIQLSETKKTLIIDSLYIFRALWSFHDFFQVLFLVSYENCGGSAFRDKVLISLSGPVGFLSLASETGAVFDFPEVPEVTSQSLSFYFSIYFILFFYVVIKHDWTHSTHISPTSGPKQQLQASLRPDFNPEETFLDKGG